MDLSHREGYKPKKNCNGCGTGWNAKLVPNFIFWLNVKDTCCIHDDRYEHGLTIEDKKEGDREFRNNMLRKINAQPWYFPKSLARAIANNRYRIVRDFGGPAFWDGK